MCAVLEISKRTYYKYRNADDHDYIDYLVIKKIFDDSKGTYGYRRITEGLKIEYGVILHTIGVYSVNTKDKFVINAKKEITKIVFSHNGILQMHGFYIDREDKNISFDIIIDFKIKNREELYQKIYDEIQEKYKDYKLNITLDIDVSD